MKRFHFIWKGLEDLLAWEVFNQNFGKFRLGYGKYLARASNNLCLEAI
ncbi:MAG: hypothetical protein ACI9KN_000268 [Gammaproteobacteria bacterium]|jgi:hypothetical protein